MHLCLSKLNDFQTHLIFTRLQYLQISFQSMIFTHIGLTNQLLQLSYSNECKHLIHAFPTK